MNTATQYADPTAAEAQWYLRNAALIEPVITFIRENPDATIRQVARGTGFARLNVERVFNMFCASGRLEWKCREAR